MLKSNRWKCEKIYIIGKDRCKLQPIDIWKEYIEIKNKKKIRFVVVVYVLLWLRFCMEIKIHDE